MGTKYTEMSMLPGGVQFLMEILQQFFALILRHSDISLTAGSNTAEALTRSVMGIRLSMFFTIRSLTFFISGGSLGATAQIFLIRALISDIALRFGLTSLISECEFLKVFQKAN